MSGHGRAAEARAPALPSYHEHYIHGAYAPYVRERRLAGAAGTMLEAAQPAGDFSDPPVSDLVLIRVLSGGSAHRCDFGGGRFAGRCPADALCLVAPDTATDILIDDPHVIQVLALPAAAMRAPLEELRPAGDPFDFGRLHAGVFRLDLVRELMDRMWLEAGLGGPAGRLFAEGAALAILAALAREADGPPAPARGGLAPWRLRRATELMAAHLDRDLGLAELAAAAGLSPSHFTRAFKRSTGRPPHRYLMERRVEHAQRLLASTDAPLAEVASDCGFADQSHLSTAFRRLLGATPGAWRGAVRR